MLSQELVTPFSTSSPVYYRGAWQPGEQALIEDAVACTDILPEARLPMFGKPWVCLRLSVGDETIFLAHRFGASQVLRAGSAAELARCIRPPAVRA